VQQVVLGGKIAGGVGGTRELPEGVDGGEKVIGNGSRFQDTPHYWAEAWLSLAYAVACVEVVCQRSERARALYNRIVEVWSDAEMKAVSAEISSIIPESGKERIKNAFLHPGTELLPDPNRLFRDLKKLFTDIEVDERFFGEGPAELERMISEFIIVGFNREADIDNGRCRVLPSEQGFWLIWAVAMRSILDSYKITFEKVRDFYKVRKYKGKVIDFQGVLREQPMSRLHREIVVSARAANLKLKNDKTIVKAAHHWYQCRVVFPSINKYCAVFENYQLEPKNISKQIRLCDEALGYTRRLPKRKGK
jgi:hypothetical protein